MRQYDPIIMKERLIYTFILCIANYMLLSESKVGQFLFVDKLELFPSNTTVQLPVFKAYLVINQLLTKDEPLTFECQAVVAKSLSDALDQIRNPQCNFTLSMNFTTTTVVTTTTTVATTTLANTTLIPGTTVPTTPIPPYVFSDWVPDTSSFIMTKDRSYRILTVNRRLPVVSSNITELVVLTCCVRDPVTYQNLSSAMVVSALLQPDYCNNCTGGPRSGDLTLERNIQNPAFLEVAPCPCDMTFSSCDVNCCCDSECTEDDKKVFSSCIPGLLGGLSAPTQRYKCESNHVNKEDWFPLMCVMFEHNGFLGYFYANTPKITEKTVFDNMFRKKKNIFTFKEAERLYQDSNAALKEYKDGVNILTYNRDGTTTKLDMHGVLTLPQRTSTGICSEMISVRFLRDFKTDCVRQLTADTCQSNTFFSSLMYVEPNSTYNQRAYRVRMKYGDQNRTVVYTGVDYYCTDDLSPYLMSSTQGGNTNLRTIITENCSHPCQDPKCLEYNEKTNPPPAIKKCPWTVPTSPVLYNGLSCSYPVLSVDYRFTWSGTTITNLKATIIVANNVSLPLKTSTLLTQKIAVSFQHEKMATNNTTPPVEPFSRSGNPGYDFEKPILSGCSDNVSRNIQFVNTNESHQMAVWEPDANGFCDPSKRKTLMFGVDVQSGCKLRLSLDDLNNCTSLKTQVFNFLSILMPSDRLGRYGVSDVTNMTHWIEVIRDIPFYIFNVDNKTKIQDVTDNRTFYTAVDMEDFIRGFCSNITNGIHLDVLYAESGQVRAYPIREIVGARVSFTVTDWQFSCTGPGSVVCWNNNLEKQTFLLTSSVRFVKVPVKISTDTIKFYLSHPSSCSSDSCIRYFENIDQSICHYDTCWRELLYPLTDAYTAEPPMYSLAFSLVLALFGVGYFIIIYSPF